MDLHEHVAAVVAALAEGDVQRVRAPDVSGRMPAAGRYDVTDVMPRRNVVFVSWNRPADGATGTWILSFDREGRVTHWNEV